MKILRNAIINSLIMLLFNSCAVHYGREFLAKYEFEDFTQFNGVDMSFRGFNKQKNLVVYGYAPHLINNSSNAGFYIVILDRNDYRTIKTELTLTENYVNADTIKLQQLAQTFIKYEIPRLKVDTAGNVFVYLADVETLAFIRFVNESEMLKHPRKWVNIKSNWYKSK